MYTVLRHDGVLVDANGNPVRPSIALPEIEAEIARLNARKEEILKAWEALTPQQRKEAGEPDTEPSTAKKEK